MSNIVKMGDVRSTVAREGKELIHKAINKGCEKYDDFWVILRATVDPFESQRNKAHAVLSRALIVAPEKYRELRGDASNFKGWLNSLCVHVIKGDIVKVITRPKDLPTQGIEMSGDTNENISETARDLKSPLVY